MKNIHLTDEQYFEILQKILQEVEQPRFEGSVHDSTTIGDKYTESNCGMCSEKYTTKENALFPDEFPERKSLKYRETWQRCPFDSRKDPDLNGCYYFCILRKKPTSEKLIELAKEAINDYCAKIANGTVI